MNNNTNNKNKPHKHAELIKAWADYDNHSIESFDNHIAFITDAELVEDDKDIIAALKQIKSEQKSNNE